MAKQNREGTVTFRDASLAVWEEGLHSNMTFQERDQWEEDFKVQVFKRMVWMLRKLGWQTEIDAEDFADTKKRHGLKFAQRWASRSRLCSHGDLKGEIQVSGRCIKFEMWQGVNTPTRPDHGGKYESNKEAVMPYLLRLRMERTRRKLRDYLLHLFEGYTFEDKSPRASNVGVGALTAIEALEQRIKRSGHYKAELGHAEIHAKPYRYSADRVELQHGVTMVYSFDHRGRPFYGTAYYDLNGNWNVHTGKYHCLWQQYHNKLYVNPPQNLRMKRNADRRRSRLEGEMAKAVKAMDFKRAEVIKNILFPTNEQLYVVKHPEGKYHRSNFCGYTHNLIDAGKFTKAEIGRYADNNEIIPLAEAS